MAIFYWKISPKSSSFEASSLGLEFQVSRVSVSEFLMKSRSRRFNEVSVWKVAISTTSLAQIASVTTSLGKSLCSVHEQESTLH